MIISPDDSKWFLHLFCVESGGCSLVLVEFGRRVERSAENVARMKARLVVGKFTFIIDFQKRRPFLLSRT